MKKVNTRMEIRKIMKKEISEKENEKEERMKVADSGHDKTLSDPSFQPFIVVGREGQKIVSYISHRQQQQQQQNMFTFNLCPGRRLVERHLPVDVGTYVCLNGLVHEWV